MRIPHRLTLLKALLITAWSSLGLYVAIGSVPESPLSISARQRVGLITIIPEGWGFFTKNPRDKWAFAFREVNGQYQPASLVGSRLGEALGANRRSRLVEAEIGQIATMADMQKSWIQCEDSLESCLAAKAPATPLTAVNTIVSASLCGRIVIQKRPPIPWAWSDLEVKPVMPSEFQVFDVRCSS
jgi:antimicrobial peptide system SdpA family protein